MRSPALRYAITTTLCGAAAMLVSPQSPRAQSRDQPVTLHRVEVTGSRIKRVDAETAQPVLVIERAALEATGLQNVGDVLRNLTQADSLGLTNLTSDTNANDGTQTISLRGLGSDRTLVLVNGRRWVSLAGGNVDTTTIPTAIIERVEVLADGASAIYGSDAIAGVINIILRDKYEGLEGSVYFGQYEEGDGDLLSYSTTLGTSSDRGSVILNVAKTEQDPVGAGDRPSTALPVDGLPFLANSVFNPFGRFAVPRSAVPHLGLPPGGAVRVTLNPAREGAGTRSAEDFTLYNQAVHSYNFAPANHLLTPSTRLSAYAQARYDLTDNLRFFSQFNFNQRKSETAIAPVPVVMGFAGPPWRFCYSRDNHFNPFGVDICEVGFRTIGRGPRTSIQDYDTYGLTVGLDGFFSVGERSMSWDVFYSRSESTRAETGEGFINLFALRAGVGPSFVDSGGIARCGRPGAVIAGCVPVNFFNGQTGFTQEMQNYISYTLVKYLALGNDDWGANLTGDLWELPAGPLAFAAGVEWRKSTIADIPDSLVAGGGSSTNFREPTSGHITVEEAYLELNVPVLAAVPGAERLELTIAGRTSDYENVGLVGSNVVERDFDADNFKYGFAWKPFGDLLVRGNYADTFRAPSVANLFAGGGEGFPGAIDPCTFEFDNPFAALTPEQQARCFAQGVPAGGTDQGGSTQIRGLFGGNPFLLPEGGNTKTLGLVYSPRYVEGLDFTLDWWKITLNDALASRSAAEILNGCIRGGDPVDCSFIERDATGRIAQVRNGQFNVTTLQVEGYDVNVNYRFSTDWGDFAIRSETTYYAGSKQVLGALSEAQNLVGHGAGAFGAPTWRIRSNLNVGWTHGDFGLNWGFRYLSRVWEDCSGLENFLAAGLATRQLCSHPEYLTASGTARNYLGGTTYHDVQVIWKGPRAATVRIGMRNLFGKEPPKSLNAFANTFIQAYDIPGGGFYYVSYTQSF